MRGLLAGAGLALILAACGNGQTPAPAAAPVAAAPAPTAPPVAAPPAPTTPAIPTVSLVEPEELFSGGDWSKDLEKALTAAGLGDKIDYIKGHVSEKGGGWPPSLADEEIRHFQPSTMKMYKFVEITRLKYFKQDAVVLQAPAELNKDMPEGFRPAEDFYIIVTPKAVGG